MTFGVGVFIVPFPSDEDVQFVVGKTVVTLASVMFMLTFPDVNDGTIVRLSFGDVKFESFGRHVKIKTKGTNMIYIYKDIKMSERHYESFPTKEESVCEKIIKYCTPSKSQSPVSKQPRRRRRSVYTREERSKPGGEICITEYKREESEI